MERRQFIAFWKPHRVGLVVSLMAIVAHPAIAQRNDGQAEELPGQTNTVSLLVGRSTIIRAPWPVKTVSLTDPKIANVEALTDRLVLVQGRSGGSTDLFLLSEGGEHVWQARIDVDVDIRRIAAELARLFPESTLQVEQSENLVVVTGVLARAEHSVRLHTFLDAYGVKYVDMTTLAGVEQVQLRVRVAEATRQAIRALGIDTTFRITTERGLGPPFGLDLWPNVGTNFATGTVGPTTGLVTLLAGFSHVDLDLFVEALAENAYLRILAEPTLVALSGEEASFLAGGEFPIPVVQGGGLGGAPTITIEYKEFGVQLKFLPTVLGDNRIRLYVAPEVSELTDIGAVVIEGFSVPALVSRKMATTLELRSGQTFAMAGLLQQTTLANKDRFPGLGDLPVLGPLFRSVRYQQTETELVVLVTASLVDPLALESVPPLPGTVHVPPDDWELYIEGRIEGGGPPARISSTDAAYLKELGLSRLKGPGAWTTYGTPSAESRGTVRLPTAATSIGVDIGVVANPIESAPGDGSAGDEAEAPR